MKKGFFKRCPKSNNIVGINTRSVWYRLFFPVMGLLSLAWFLLRVIPKPSRISYPCQRAALPMAVAFLSFIGGAKGAAKICRIIKSRPPARAALKSIGSVAAMCLVIYFVFPVLFLGCRDTTPNLPVATLPHTEPPPSPTADEAAEAGLYNLPVTREIRTREDIFEFYRVPARGVGIHPGRVVVMRNPAAVRFDGSGYWWQDEHTVPEEVSSMFAQSMLALTGQLNIAGAWDALFRYFNGGAPYRPGEKIAIKLNMNQDRRGRTPNLHLPAPQLIAALVSDLVHVVGAAPEDITLTDPSRPIGDATYYYFRNHPDPALRRVRFVAQNRIPPEADRTQPLHFADGQIGYVPTDFTAAAYLINFALFRPHDHYGITFIAKNHYGSVQFGAGNSFSPVSMHSSWNNGYGEYSHLTDLLAFYHLGGKTILNIIDGLYSAYHQSDGNVRRMYSFGGYEFPALLFLSQDPVAIDSVAYDFLKIELELNSRFIARMPGRAFDNYLIEAAFLDRPPSNTDYDPNRTGVRVSLGAFETWNNPVDRQYSRNLGRDFGIELIQIGFD